ncbi:phage tail tape measure protein [Haematospirillum sp. 15-248]|uniref:phage tail tape measure protein n=1 Tax=Haematospirillum sp. 15-248 TaxID=2723107 RepID=UPI0014386E2F|nr:phage tail tape measure protein [Haematospirillum sp. 15-248]NKD88728.1 phage tail tape measure protein [Haematospirillum sp. 15-248]
MSDLKIQVTMAAADKMTAPFKTARSSAEKLKEAMRGTTSEIKALEKSSAGIQAISRLEVAAKADASALAEARNKARSLERALTEGSGGTKRAERAFAAAQKTVEKLEKSTVSNKEKIKALHHELSEAGVETKDLAAAQKILEGRLDTARKAAEGQASALGVLQKKSDAMATARSRMDRTTALAGNLAMAGASGVATGGGILAGMGVVLRDGIAFEKQMSAVGAVARLDKTSAEFAALGQQAMALGATTSFSASEAAEGMQKLAMAGFDAKQILASMPGMLDLAKAGNTNLGEAADIASNILSGFGLEAAEMSRLGDVMAATFTRANVDLGMLGETMKYTAPIARQVGASVEDVSAMSGLLGNIGIQGAQAGTALRALFSRLASPPGDARKALLELSVATQDAAGNMRPITEILADVAKGTKGLGSADRLAAFTAIAGTEAGAAMASLVEREGEGAISKFSEVLKQAGGEASRLAKAMGDNAAGDIQGFWSAVEGLNITLSQTQTSPLRDLVQSATSVVRATAEWVKANPALAGTLFKVAASVAGLVLVGGILATVAAAIIGPIAILRFAVVSLGIKAGLAGGGIGLFSGAIGFMGTVAKTVFPALLAWVKQLNLAFLMNPIVLAVMAIATAVTLIVVFWGPLKAFFARLWQSVSGIFAGAWDVIKAAFAWTPLGLVVSNWEPIAGYLGTLWQGLSDTFAQAWGCITSGIEAIKAPLVWISDMIARLTGGFGEAVSAAGSALSGVGGDLAKKTVKVAATAGVAATVSGAAVAKAPPGQGVDMGGVSITIHAAAGQSETDIARAVRLELEKMMARERSNARARMYDEED